ncbi:MAG: hypothetical protein IKE30_03545 [Clostridia bacterium]|nr:hypothetical protein [Clostridia bacterium]
MTGIKKGTVKITATSTKDKTVVGEFTVEVVEAIPGEAEAAELPDAEPAIEEPEAEEPLPEEPAEEEPDAGEEPSAEQPAPEAPLPEEELNDWYGEDADTPEDWCEEF